MTTWAPNLVSDELVALSQTLGSESRDLAILAEGNTSERLPDGRLVVKASGASLKDTTHDDFVCVDVQEMQDLVADPNADQSALSAALISNAAHSDGRPRRGSIETLVHSCVAAAADRLGDPMAARFVGHTHPTDVVGLLASTRAQEAWQHLVYSDEAVVVGRPLFVPYATPGIDLGRIYSQRLNDYVDQHHSLPQLVLLANHGIVAIAPTSAGIEAVSLMAVKGARVRAIAYSVGGVNPLSDESVDKFFARDDVNERRSAISQGL